MVSVREREARLEEDRKKDELKRLHSGIMTAQMIMVPESGGLVARLLEKRRECVALSDDGDRFAVTRGSGGGRPGTGGVGGEAFSCGGLVGRACSCRRQGGG